MSLTKLDLVNDKVFIPLLILNTVFGMEIWILSLIYLMLQWFIRLARSKRLSSRCCFGHNTADRSCSCYEEYRVSCPLNMHALHCRLYNCHNWNILLSMYCFVTEALLHYSNIIVLVPRMSKRMSVSNGMTEITQQRASVVSVLHLTVASCLQVQTYIPTQHYVHILSVYLHYTYVCTYVCTCC